jgi:hypothetical protein
MDTETLLWILAAGLATGLGGLALLLVPRPSDYLLDVLLGFTAGVMLAATAFSLLVPALDEGTLAEVLAGVLVGGTTLLARHAGSARSPALVERGHATRHQPARAALSLTINIPGGGGVCVSLPGRISDPIALATAPGRAGLPPPRPPTAGHCGRCHRRRRTDQRRDYHRAIAVAADVAICSHSASRPAVRCSTWSSSSCPRATHAERARRLVALLIPGLSLALDNASENTARQTEAAPSARRRSAGCLPWPRSTLASGRHVRCVDRVRATAVQKEKEEPPSYA